MTGAESAPVPEHPQEEVWLAPPIGGDPKHETKEEKVDPAVLNDVVDKITDGIGKLWHIVAEWTHDSVWEHSQADLWGYSVIVGYVIKKAKNWELVLLGMAVMSILAVETMKMTTYMAHRRPPKQGGSPAESDIPPGAL